MSGQQEKKSKIPAAESDSKSDRHFDLRTLNAAGTVHGCVGSLPLHRPRGAPLSRPVTGSLQQVGVSTLNV